jgi:hypothetical protein
MLVIDGDITWWEILILLLLLVAGDTRVVDWVCIGIVLLVVLWFIGWFVDEVLGLLLFVWIDDAGRRSDDNYDEVIFVGNIYKLHYLHKVRTLSRICWIIVVFHCYDIFYIVYDYNKGKIIVNKHK